MVKIERKPEQIDPIWVRMLKEAEVAAAKEPLIGSMLQRSFLLCNSWREALACQFAGNLYTKAISEQALYSLALEVCDAAPDILDAARADLMAILQRDPACDSLLTPFIFFKGFHALQAYRISHALWQEGRRDLASFIQMRCSERFTVDIHPAAKMGKGIMLDHAHSLVVGETAVVSDSVSILHSVTLGGTGKETGDRHPKIGECVLIGAGAKILGNVKVGDCSKVAAGSVVLQDVPSKKTVAGIPARVVGDTDCTGRPALDMNQLLD